MSGVQVGTGTKVIRTNCKSDRTKRWEEFKYCRGRDRIRENRRDRVDMIDYLNLDERSASGEAQVALFAQRVACRWVIKSSVIATINYIAVLVDNKPPLRQGKN